MTKTGGKNPTSFPLTPSSLLFFIFVCCWVGLDYARPRGEGIEVKKIASFGLEKPLSDAALSPNL